MSAKTTTYRTRRAKGLCIACAVESKTTFCPRCNEDMLVKRRARRDRLLREGLCLVCRKPRENLDKTLCWDCAEKHNEKMKARYRGNTNPPPLPPLPPPNWADRLIAKHPGLAFALGYR